MKKYLFGWLLALLTVSAVADLSATSSDGNVYVAIKAEACDSSAIKKIIADIDPNVVDQFGKADLVIKGKHIPACYTLLGDEVMVITEQGAFPVPAMAFKDHSV